MALLGRYPYLATCLAVAAGLGLLILFRRDRRDALLSGLLMAPAAFASILYVPDYWQPARVGTLFRTGPEDLLFSFTAGCWIWLFAFGPGPAPPRLALAWPRSLVRYAGYFLVGYALVRLAAPLVGWAGWAEILAIVLIGGILLIRQRPHWRRAVVGGVGFAALHTVVAAAALAAWPHFNTQWNHVRLSGAGVGAVPVEETLWALATGFTWVLFLYEIRAPETGSDAVGGLARAGRVRP